VGILRGGDHLEDPGIDGRNIKMDIQEWDERIRNELIWLKAGAGGGGGALVNSVMNLQVP